MGYVHAQLPGAIKAVSRAAVGVGSRASPSADAQEHEEEAACEQGQAISTHAGEFTQKRGT